MQTSCCNIMQQDNFLKNMLKHVIFRTFYVFEIVSNTSVNIYLMTINCTEVQIPKHKCISH